ncbi:MAG: hypothetical protein ACHQT8_08110, partial [Chlamydiales bacterium]
KVLDLYQVFIERLRILQGRLISGMRNSANDDVTLVDKILQTILTRNGFSIDQAFITDKLFVEVAGHGYIRGAILDKERVAIEGEKNALKNKLLK